MMKKTVMLSLACLCIVFISIVPVQADLAIPVITHVFFQKGGVPYNGSVHYTVTCYGYDPGPSYPHYNPRPAPGQSGYTQEGSVFSYSATCQNFGCTIYEPYYRIYGSTSQIDTDRCDLQGEISSGNFTISNFSDKPFTQCSGIGRQHFNSPINYPEPGSIYFETGEYSACNSHYRNWSFNVTHKVYQSCNPTNDSGCFEDLLPDGRSLKQIAEFITVKNGTDMDLKQYIHYLEICDPSTDPDCPGDIIDGRPLKTITAFRPFRNVSLPLDYPCDTFLVRANPSLFVPQYACNRSECDNSMAKVLCELRVSIPHDNQTPVDTPVPNDSLYSPQSPIESLYCSILQFFGARC